MAKLSYSEIKFLGDAQLQDILLKKLRVYIEEISGSGHASASSAYGAPTSEVELSYTAHDIILIAGIIKEFPDEFEAQVALTPLAPLYNATVVPYRTFCNIILKKDYGYDTWDFSSKQVFNEMIKIFAEDLASKILISRSEDESEELNNYYFCTKGNYSSEPRHSSLQPFFDEVDRILASHDTTSEVKVSSVTYADMSGAASSAPLNTDEAAVPMDTIGEAPNPTID